MFFIWHGDDEYSLQQALREQRAALGDAATADLNTAVLDGRALSLDELRTTCDTMPFLSDRRLVIVEGFLARYEPRANISDSGKAQSDPLESGLRQYLPALPDSALLIFAERSGLSERNSMFKTLKELGASVKEYAAPGGAALTTWIVQQVRAAGGDIALRAADTLGAFVGSNLRQLAQEVDKLIAYAGDRQIQDADVQQLVGDAREMKVWTLTDAVAAGHRDLAVQALHHMLNDGAQPLMLMAMITRQFRILIQVKDLAEARYSADDIARQLRLNPYGARRAMETARGFSFERLDAIYRHLLDTDLAVKTGRLEPVLALDLLVIEITSLAAARR